MEDAREEELFSPENDPELYIEATRIALQILDWLPCDPQDHWRGREERAPLLRLNGLVNHCLDMLCQQIHNAWCQKYRVQRQAPTKAVTTFRGHLATSIISALLYRHEKVLDELPPRMQNVIDENHAVMRELLPQVIPMSPPRDALSGS